MSPGRQPPKGDWPKKWTSRNEENSHAAHWVMIDDYNHPKFGIQGYAKNDMCSLWFLFSCPEDIKPFGEARKGELLGAALSPGHMPAAALPKIAPPGHVERAKSRAQFHASCQKRVRLKRETNMKTGIPVVRHTQMPEISLLQIGGGGARGGASWGAHALVNMISLALQLDSHT